MKHLILAAALVAISPQAQALCVSRNDLSGWPPVAADADFGEIRLSSHLDDIVRRKLGLEWSDKIEVWGTLETIVIVASTDRGCMYRTWKGSISHFLESFEASKS